MNTYAYPCGLAHVDFGPLQLVGDCWAPSLATYTLLMSGIRCGARNHARCTGPALAIRRRIARDAAATYRRFQMEAEALEHELMALAAVSFDGLPV